MWYLPCPHKIFIPPRPDTFASMASAAKDDTAVPWPSGVQGFWFLVSGFGGFRFLGVEGLVFSVSGEVLVKGLVLS